MLQTHSGALPHLKKEGHPATCDHVGDPEDGVLREMSQTRKHRHRALASRRFLKRQICRAGWCCRVCPAMSQAREFVYRAQSPSLFCKMK